MPLVTSGVEYGNLRELALARMRDFGTVCRDVRTREVGIVDIHTKVKPEEVELVRRDYEANNGWETFLSYEDPKNDILVRAPFSAVATGPLTDRARSVCFGCASAGPAPSAPSSSIDALLCASCTSTAASCQSTAATRKSFSTRCARLCRRCAHSKSAVAPCQGFGTLLMEEAERIAREEHRSVKLAVIAGVGTRHYYRKLGYELDGPYMSKMLSDPVDDDL